jgi:hypothetical protein
LSDAVPQPEDDEPTLPTHTTLAQIVLVGGMVQVLASVALALARIDELKTAVAEGPLYYVLATLLAAIALVAAWAVRERPALSLPLLLGWPLLVWLSIGKRLTALGLAYHGEFILYHFLSLVAAALCLLVPLRWATRRELGRARMVPLVSAAIGASLLALVHLAAIPFLRLEGSEALGRAGSAFLLASWPLALALFWKHARPWNLRVVAALLVLPVTLRVILAGPTGLSGAPVAHERIFYLGACLVLVAVAIAFLFRPRIELWVRAMIGGLCLFSTAFAWILYDRGFGELEDGFDGLIRSFLGFALPYPAYVDEWKVVAMMTAMFLVLMTIYTALVSTRDRHRGVPLAIMALAGIGLTSPHLVLMLGAAALVLFDTLLEDEVEEEAQQEAAPDILVEEVMTATAQRLDFEAPVVLNEGRGRVVVLRGELGGVDVDARAREKGKRWTVEISAGLAGRGSPKVELAPDRGKRGTRPSHPLGRTHRIIGEPRALEAQGEQLFDALTGFAQSRTRVWLGGCAIELGRELTALDVDRLEALLRAAVKIID